MTRILEFLAKHRLATVAVTVSAALAVGLQARHLEIDNALDVWFVRGDPALQAYHQFLDDFGNDEVVVTALRGFDDPLSAASLERLGAVSTAMARVEGVQRVLSLSTLRLLDADAAELRFGTLGAEPGAAIGPAQLRAAVARGGLASRLVGRNGHSLVLYTWLEAAPDIDARRPQILDQLRAACDQALAGAPIEVSHAGMGVMYDAINRATLGEGALFIGLSYLVIAAALFVVSGRLTWTLLAALAVSLANAVVLGAMVLLGRPLTMYTMTIPALVMVLGVANVLHLATATPEAGRKGVLGSLMVVAAPCLFNALTTAGGFLSLRSASTAITRDFGLFAALGVVLAFVFAAALFAAASSRLAPPRCHQGARGLLSRLAERCWVTALRHRRATLAAGVGLAAAGALGVARLPVDTLAIDFLPDRHGFRDASAAVERSAGPYLPLELVLTRAEGATWRDPALVEALRRTQRRIEAELELGASLSVADVLLDLRAALDQTPVAATALPASELELGRLVGVLELAGDDPNLDALVAHGGRAARLTIGVPMGSARSFERAAGAARAIAEQELGGLAEVSFGGYLPLNWEMAHRVVADQVRSFALAFAVVLALLWLVLRDGRLVLAALPANLLPVLMVLGFMGWAGFRLDIATVTIAAAVLGIVVDDSVHLLYQLRHALARGLPFAEAARGTARSAGAAVLSTSLVFCAGFGVIALSSVHSVAEVGLLTAVAVAFALAGDLLLLPAVLSLVLRVPRAELAAPTRDTVVAPPDVSSSAPTVFNPY